MKNSSGFTLVEMAVVLAILGLLLGSIALPLTTWHEQRKLMEAHATLKEISEALMTHAAIHGVLPCPTSTTDPADGNYGLADAACASSVEGILPWKTLGVSETDPWGTKRTKASDPWAGHWRYRVDRRFSDPEAPFTLATEPASNLKVSDRSEVPFKLTADKQVIAIIYSPGKNGLPDGENADADLSYESDAPGDRFDDVLVWLSRYPLVSRMVAAGRLP